jgi:hypothetical protein
MRENRAQTSKLQEGVVFSGLEQTAVSLGSPSPLKNALPRVSTLIPLYLHSILSGAANPQIQGLQYDIS